MAKCICSIAIEGSESIEIPITDNPGRAKSFDIKRRRAIFYHDYSGKYKIPEYATKMSLPNYHAHMHNIDYGIPYYT